MSYARYGDKPPVWVSILIAAEAWGKAPWEIAGGSPLLWFWRFVEYNHAMTAKPTVITDDNIRN